MRLTVEALKDARGAQRLHVARDGVEAMAFLRKGTYARRAAPDLILLDLNLPRKDGREVLAEIKQDDALRHIPVVVLTTSQAEQDILQSYRLHANAYVTKPVGPRSILRASCESIEEFWLEVVKLARP